MRKPVIPEIPPADPQTYLLLKAVKENLDQLTGVRGGPIAPLSVIATLPDVIAKVNEIVERLNR